MSDAPSGVYATVGLEILAVPEADDREDVVKTYAHIEAGYRFGFGLELGAAFAIPRRLAVDLRMMFLRRFFQLGVYAGVTIILPKTTVADLSVGPFVGYAGGLALGMLWELGPVHLGARLQTGPTYVSELQRIELPIDLSVYAVF